MGDQNKNTIEKAEFEKYLRKSRLNEDGAGFVFMSSTVIPSTTRPARKGHLNLS